MRSLLLALILLSVLLGAAFSAEQPVIPAVEVSAPPILDGDLSDECWKEAPSVTDFYFLPNGSSASEPTQTWLCYDQENIYLAFYCRDSQPDMVSGVQKKRGGDIDSDDWVGVDLDCRNKQDNVVWFDVTAGGTQVENNQSGNATKIEWRGDWSAAAKRVSDGYAVEMAIPWSILKYDAKQTSMGVAFIRRHHRTSQWWWSPNLGPLEDKRLFYKWDGLRLPDTAGKPLILPYVLVGSGGDTDTTAGIDYKQALGPNSTLLATINPDFRNVEQDVEEIDFTYKERELGDSRPFFEEGKNFLPGNDMFYSRRIDEMDYGAKFMGTAGDVEIGAMHGACPEGQGFDVMQVRRSWSTDAHVALSAASSRFPGDDQFAWNLTGFKLLRQRDDRKLETKMTFSSIRSDSTGEVGSRFYWRVSSDNGPGVIRWDVRTEVIDADYDPRLGYVPERDVRRYEAYINIHDEPSSGSVSSIWSGMDLKKVDYLSGDPYYSSTDIWTYREWRGGSEGYAGIYFEDRPPYKDNMYYAGYGWGKKTLSRKGGVEFALGDVAGGDYLRYYVYQGWELGERLSTQASYEHSEIKDPSPEAFSSSQFIDTLSYDIDNERTLSGRAVLRDGDTNFYLCYRQRVRSGMDVFVIFGNPNADTTENSFAMKLVKPL